jgi:hypothetical protein
MLFEQYKISHEYLKFSGAIFYCNSYLQKLRGFIFYLKIPFLALIFPGVKIIHTFFVFFKLAVFILDSEGSVIDKFIIKPWRISCYYPNCAYLVEFTDVALFAKINIGDRLILEKQF